MLTDLVDTPSLTVAVTRLVYLLCTSCIKLCAICILFTVGYIDLSKRRVSPEDIEKCEEKYNKAKTVNGILRHVAEELEYTNEELEDLYERTAWRLEEDKAPGSAYQDFKKAVVYVNACVCVCVYKYVK